MTVITRFEEIEAWKTARQLTNTIYELGNQTGFNRDFGIRDQIRRASVSIMSNFAEGFECRTDVQFINFLGLARASSGEVRAQLYVALAQNYIMENNSRKLFLWQKYVLVKLQNLSLILKLIQESDVFLMMVRFMKSN